MTISCGVEGEAQIFSANWFSKSYQRLWFVCNRIWWRLSCVLIKDVVSGSRLLWKMPFFWNGSLSLTKNCLLGQYLKRAFRFKFFHSIFKELFRVLWFWKIQSWTSFIQGSLLSCVGELLIKFEVTFYLIFNWWKSLITRQWRNMKRLISPYSIATSSRIKLLRLWCFRASVWHFF